MFKFVKISFICLLVVVCSLFGVKVYNGYTESQVDFLPQNNVTAIPPSSYDLRDFIDIGVENQYTFGICYAFASLTSLETYLALNYGEYYDFSELHFATSLYLKDNYYSSINEAFQDGGNFTHFALYTQKDKSLVLEEEFPMDKYRTLPNNNYSAQLVNNLISDFNRIENNHYSIAKVNDTKTFNQYVGNKANYSSTKLTNFRNSVKNHIMNYGSLTAGIYTGTGFSNSTINYRITDNSLVTDQSTINSNINHLISIVGWDDEYDANGAWTNKGAYICLNSWGTGFGDDGYFYVSYDDYFIESTIQGITSASLSTTNNKISSITNHQEKTAIFNHVFSAPYPTIYTANIFDTSSYLGQNITYIDTFIKGGTTKFFIKFFNSRANALAGINSVSTLIGSTKVDDYSMYTKYQLSTPLNISGNYMVVVREVQETVRTHSLCGNTSDNLNIEPSYWNGSGVGTFNIAEDVWDPDVSNRELDCTLPLILHTNKQYVQVSPFDSQWDAVTGGKYVKNNAIFQNKSIQLNLTNVNLTQNIINNIKITKLYNKSFVNITSNFEITLNSVNCINIKMINDLSSSFTAGNYLLTIPCGDTTIYRIIEVQDAVTYSIEYHLDGGTATNPNVYTSRQTSLNLNNPVKNGFTFVGWYTNSALTQVFNPNSLPYTNLTLYAKYDFATPTITSKSSDVNITFYPGLNVNISVTASHSFANSLNILTYQWYMRKTLADTFAVVSGATSSSLSLHNVNQSGYYTCSVSITLNDPNLVSSSCVKTLLPSQDNAIQVTIKPYVYDMSNVKWNYTSPISYDAKLHTIELINLPSGVTANYTNNSKTNIGNYVAHADLVYDNMNGNAIVNNVNDLNWQIRKAKIKIIINDIISTEELSNEILSSMYSCQIENEYLPENVVSLQDKINYLNLVYKLQNTSQPYIKLITATINNFNIYDVTIVSGEYRVVKYSLTSNNITSTNNNGFVQNCTFSAKTGTLDNNTSNLLKEQNLTLVNSYDLTYSYLHNDTITVNIPIERSRLLNNLSVYMLKNNKLVKLDTKTSINGLSFTTSEQNATYIIVQEDYSHNSNTQMLVLTIIIGIYIALCVYAIINGIKHKNDY